jgi:hypothetical protein
MLDERINIGMNASGTFDAFQNIKRAGAFVNARSINTAIE